MEEIMEKKSFKFDLKELNEDGTFEGYASTFDKVDHGNDLIVSGAFKKTLKENEQFPVHWYHRILEPVGGIHGEEDSKGLKVQGYLVLEVQRAKELYALMQKKVVNMLSIGYDVIKSSWDTVTGIRTLKEIKLWEVSIVTWGMDQEALITDVKNFCPSCGEGEFELKPYPNEHSARIKDPAQFNPKNFRRKKDGTIYGKIKVPTTAAVIWGKLKEHDKPSDNPIPQAIRFPISDWTVAQAKTWLKDNNVKYEKFEPAEKSLEGVLQTIIDLEVENEISADTSEFVLNAIQSLKALPIIEEPSPEDTPQGEKPYFKDDKSRIHLLSSFTEELKQLNKSMEVNQ